MRNTEADYLRRLEQYINFRNKYLEVHERWFQSLLIASAGLLGALVALSDNTSEHQNVRILFVVTVILISLGILSVSFALSYSLVYAFRAKESSLSYLQKRTNSSEHELLVIDDPKKLRIFGALSYIFFSLSFVFLIIYVIFKNLPELIK